MRVEARRRWAGLGGCLHTNGLQSFSCVRDAPVTRYKFVASKSGLPPIDLIASEPSVYSAAQMAERPTAIDGRIDILPAVSLAETRNDNPGL